MKYRIYIDEVGNSDLSSSENPNHRFLSLTGVILDLEYMSDVVFPDLENLKKKFFGSNPDDPIILHRKELLNAKPPFEALKNHGVRARFDQELLGFLRTWKYSVITVCLDKLKHRENYSTWRYHPYHYCLAVLLERYVFFLNRNKGKGDVLAESRGGKEDRTLKDSFSRLYRNGTDFVGPEQFQNSLTSKQLKVKLKANNIAGLQLADLIAHPSRNEILHEQNLLNRELPPFGKKIIEILKGKYDRRGTDIFGKKFL